MVYQTSHLLRNNWQLGPFKVMSVQVRRFTNASVYPVSCHHFFPHSTISASPCPLPSNATPVSACFGSLSIQSKCCFYFLSVTPICQGHTTTTLPPFASPLMFLNISTSCWIIFVCSYCMWCADSLLLYLNGEGYIHPLQSVVFYFTGHPHKLRKNIVFVLSLVGL